MANCKYIGRPWYIYIDKITTDDPGVIIFENGWQVAAKPYKQGKVYSKGTHYSKYRNKVNSE